MMISVLSFYIITGICFVEESFDLFFPSDSMPMQQKASLLTVISLQFYVILSWIILFYHFVSSCVGFTLFDDIPNL